MASGDQMTTSGRVLVLSPQLPFRDDWLKATASSGFTPILASGGRAATDSPTATVPDTGMVELTSMRLRPSRLWWRINDRLRGRALVALVDRLGRQGAPIDLVHSHFFAASAGLAHLQAARGIPFVISEHSSALTRFNPQKAASRQGLELARRAYEAAAAVLPVSEYLADEIRRRGLPGRLTVVPNPIDAELFKPCGVPRTGRIITVSRLAKVKRIDLIIRAVAELAELHPGAHLDVVGDGPELKSLEQLAIDLAVDDRVTFRGEVERARIPALLSEASVFAMASYTENLPMAMLEASACGLPVVGPHHGGTAEVIGTVPGETFEPGQVGSLAQTLSHWIHPDQEQRSESRHAAVVKYSIVTVSQRLSTIYKDTLSGRDAASKP